MISDMAAPSIDAATPYTAHRLAWVCGFFFAARFALTFLFFQSDPRLGTTVYLGLSALLLTVALLATANGPVTMHISVFGKPVIRCVVVYLALCGLSLAWTQADSTVISAAYWGGMVIDCLLVVSLLRGRSEAPARSLCLGYVHGCLLLAAIAWCVPALPDQRLGHEEFLHPNGLGLHFATAAILAQHLPARTTFRRLIIGALIVSLLRTISKTSILAFAITQFVALCFSHRWAPAAKLKLIVASTVVALLFSGLFLAYADAYTNNGDQAETLTGRTAIWATAVDMALERPMLGRGIYSFRSQIPAFAAFQPWHAHNELLQQFFELGIAGVAATILYYAELFRFGRRFHSHLLRSCCLMLVVFAVIHGLADTVNFGLSLPLWLATALGLQLAVTAEGRVAA